MNDARYRRKLISIVFNNRYSDESYDKLFEHLYSCDFEWPDEIPGDFNRAADGIQLRKDLGFYDISDNKPCSILEMLIALAMRMDQDIMYSPEEGDRTGLWFWEMLANLQLVSQNDYNYDAAYVDSCIEIFLRRQYDADGSNGGLFVLNNPRKDLRGIEIWYQAMWWLTELDQ